jgi:hypothetical protein
MARPQESLKYSEFDSGKLCDVPFFDGTRLQQRKSMAGLVNVSTRALTGVPACQHDRYKKVAQDRRCFGSDFHPEFG